MAENKDDYKVRLVNEYKALKERYQRLHRMIIKYDAGKMTVEIGSPVGLLRDQEEVMRRYMNILELRACMEDIELERD